MTDRAAVTREHGNAYNIFILVLTIASLLIVVLLLLPIPQAVRDLLNVYDNVVCLIFLVDFAYNLSGSRPKREYFVYQRGWLDLLGSIPSFGFFQATGLLRLARLSRLARIRRILGGKNRKALIEDVVRNRGQYATFITILAAGIVLSVSSILMLYFEEGNPDANITTGGDSLWWAIVTITTVGYGDKYPVTPLGRTTAFLVMTTGVGIIGALASILASLLVTSPSNDAAPSTEAAGDDPMADVVKAGAGAVAQPVADPAGTDVILARLDALQAEVAALRREARPDAGPDAVGPS